MVFEPAGSLLAFLDWFTGNGAYMRLDHCMAHDWPWITLTVALDLGVAAGYALIAVHWWKNQKRVPDSPAKKALGNLRNIFLFCGLCGYLFIPIKMQWPAWRLYDMFMIVLVYFTWRYAWSAKDLKVVFSELNRSKQLEHELDVSRAETKRKSFFLNAISHDLRTPLNGMLLQTSLAEISVENGDRESLKQALSQIRDSALAASEMLNSFLDLGRADHSDRATTKARVVLGDVLKTVIDAQHDQAKARGLSLLAADCNALEIQTDRFKLERILNNLVQNAVKFTSSGSITIAAEANGHDLSIHVSDNGVGIAPEHREMLFQEFFQAHNVERDRTKGFGLGLAIAQRLARQLGGEIRCHSDGLGHGSRFTIHLPGAFQCGDDANQPAAAAVESAAASADSAAAPAVAGG